MRRRDGASMPSAAASGRGGSRGRRATRAVARPTVRPVERGPVRPRAGSTECESRHELPDADRVRAELVPPRDDVAPDCVDDVRSPDRRLVAGPERRAPRCRRARRARRSPTGVGARSRAVRELSRSGGSWSRSWRLRGHGRRCRGARADHDDRRRNELGFSRRHHAEPILREPKDLLGDCTGSPGAAAPRAGPVPRRRRRRDEFKLTLTLDQRDVRRQCGEHEEHDDEGHAEGNATQRALTTIDDAGGSGRRARSGSSARRSLGRPRRRCRARCPTVAALLARAALTMPPGPRSVMGADPSAARRAGGVAG